MIQYSKLLIPMRLHITFKTGNDDDAPHTRHFDVALSTYELLKAEFLRYLNEGATALRGAAYTYIDVDTKQGKELILRFDDLLYIEAIPLQENTEPRISSKTITTGNLNTGPLRTRITNPNSNES
jgi:hypothetical protein